ncbi:MULTISPECIES: hypothetical protein [unclassified Nostoc]|uniref:hypothetical protein n=1 Tax=unclassified Nostoc TaxID=2593658 RepID=UPI00263772BC|nr:hypothetical protein [Nostoc sp. S13]MDF5738691.1 hypothetical protein [Nostoc sp. S13]
MRANIPDEKQDSCSLFEPTERLGVRFYKAFDESEMLPEAIASHATARVNIAITYALTK